MPVRQRWLRIVAALLVGLMLVVAQESFRPAKASASTSACQHDNYFPQKGVIKTVGPVNGDVYGVSLEFTMTDAEIDNLTCFAAYLEIDFHIYDFDLPSNWQGYSVYSDLPGAVRDLSLFDSDAVPAVTGIRTADLKKKQDRTFHAAIWWRAQKTKPVPVVAVEWIPSYWAIGGPDLRNAAFCAAVGLGQVPYCVFGYSHYAYALSGTWFKSAEYNWGWLPFASNVQTFSYGGWNSSFSSGGGGYSSSMAAPPTGWEAQVGALPPPESPTRPTALQYGPSELSVFQRDADNHVKKNSWNGSSWSGFGDMGGDMLGNPASVQYGNPAELDVFSRSSGNEIRKNTWNGSSWSGWNSLGGNMVGAPSAVAYNSELSVFAKGGDGHIYKNTWNGVAWSGWNDLGGNMAGNPVAIQYGNELDVFAKGGDGQLYKNTWNNQFWSGWNTLGGTLGGDPSPVVFGSELSVFMRSSVDGWVWKITWNGSSWSQWNPMGGTFAGNPVAVAYGSEMDVFVRGTNGRIYKDTWNGSSWSGFNDLGGNMIGDPAATQWNTELSVFARSAGDHKIYKKTWNGSGWSGWNYLG